MNMRQVSPGWRLGRWVMAAMAAAGFAWAGWTGTIRFFDRTQTTNFVAAGTTSDTWGSEGYEFRLTRDKLFTGGVGLTNPVGRAVRVTWPAGMEAQAVTTGPAKSGARLQIRRGDGQPFDLDQFTIKLLANTAGAGGAIEVMPRSHGEDGLPDPAMFDVTGYYGQDFSFVSPGLVGFDEYLFSLYVDFAIISLTVVDATPPRPALDIGIIAGGRVRISWDLLATGFTLESAAALPAVAWQPVGAPVTAVGDRWEVELDAAGVSQWFRLRQ